MKENGKSTKRKCSTVSFYNIVGAKYHTQVLPLAYYKSQWARETVINIGQLSTLNSNLNKFWGWVERSKKFPMEDEVRFSSGFVGMHSVLYCILHAILRL